MRNGRLVCRGNYPFPDSPVEVAINRPFIFERQCTFIVRGFSCNVTKWQLRQLVNAFVVNGMVGSIRNTEVTYLINMIGYFPI